jgi:hypothetical protein
MKTPSNTELTDPDAVPAEMPAWFQPFAKQLTRHGGGGVQYAVCSMQCSVFSVQFSGVSIFTRGRSEH